ncbi:ABC transporter permease [Mucilaginibacter agri]|uniref:FtsX-like permease family protein n=1 Tax=Mucilaginibacter agri TaxID=2695265 RepID=A0A965ZJE4_9SPHI|nr:ABC transporter permease [Mucilaginibacter agri]NCD72225.1 FtsX-like permease family protein [Mucilaginibacter agri]
MLKNYFKTAFRSLYKNKGYSFLNIFGLAIGIACASFIFLWVENELSYDQFNTKKDQVYLTMVNQPYDKSIFTHTSTQAPLAAAMQSEIPGIAQTCRTSEGETSMLFSVGDRSMYASGKYAEPSLFSMFTLSFMEGNAQIAFSQLHSLVITQSTALKFFGTDRNVVGKTIRVDNKQDYVVSGLIKDIPRNSSMQFEWVAPFQITYNQNPWMKSWDNSGITTYVELKPGVDPEAVNKQLKNFVQRRAPQSISHPFLFNMKSWHLHWGFENGKQVGGQIEYVNLFAIIAWIILLIACINFMNLATARSEKRAREVGVRKVLGAGKKMLIAQFIGEALILAFAASFLAVLIITLTLPFFNILVQQQLTLGLDKPLHIGALLAMTLICGLVAGSYPSFYLSSFNPVFVLKGVKLKDSGAAFIRKALVVIQFSVSIILIVGTIVIYQQIQHVKSRNLGLNKDNLLEVAVHGSLAKNFIPVKQDMINTGYVVNAALSDHTTLGDGNNTDKLSWEGKAAGSKVLVSGRSVTPEFFATSGMHIIEGRGLQVPDSLVATENSSKITNIVITRSMAKLMGKQSPINKLLYNEGDPTMKLRVVGVVNDYVYGNMYGTPDPVIFNIVQPKDAYVMYVKLNGQKDITKGVAEIKNIVSRYNPGYPFDYHFVDDQFNQRFLTETLISELSRVFALLAIIISCLGLFGLAAYTAERRIKEIGIRKVLGATVTGITTLLSLDFLQLIGVSCLVAFPLAYLGMSQWLNNYEYRVGINWWVFALSGGAAVIIAMLTISFQSIKAALANPVNSLKNE